MSNRLKIFLLLACIIAAVASTVYALPTGGRDITYYADDTFSGDPVGERYLACGSGSWQSWGTVTPYSKAETWDCGSGFRTSCTAYFCAANDPSDPPPCRYEDCSNW
jgi:hypothetical protein